MAKRGLLIRLKDNPSKTINTATKGWTLSAFNFSDPELMTEYVTVPGRQAGDLDLSTALTDGIPVYKSRTLTATLELSEGTRTTRSAKVAELYAFLGQQCDFETPDNLWSKGRLVSITPITHDLSHTILTLKAICEPWLTDSNSDYFLYLTGWVGSELDLPIPNNGDMPSSIKVQVSGTGDVTIRSGTNEDNPWFYTLTAPTNFIVPDLIVRGHSTYNLSIHVPESAEAEISMPYGYLFAKGE